MRMSSGSYRRSRARRQGPVRTSGRGVVIRRLGYGAVLSCLVLLSVPKLAGAQSDPCVRSLTPYRHEEDWSCLRSEQQRTGYMDALKYIPLGASGSFVTLGGSARFTYEHSKNTRWGEGPTTLNTVLQRYFFHVDVRHSRSFRGFVHLGSSHEAGRKGGPRVIDEDVFDVVQVFGELALGSERRGSLVRVGRQEFNVGAGRMVSIRNGPNTRQSQDGVFVRGSWDDYSYVLFGSQPVTIQDGGLDNRRDGWFWGVNLTRRWSGGVLGDFYYFGRAQEIGAGLEALDDRRHTVGSRLYGRVSRLSYDMEGALQLGETEDGREGAFRDIVAWTVGGGATLSVPVSWGRPELVADFGLVSGDRSGTSALERFQPPFPRGSYFGQIAALGPGNTSGFRVLGRIVPLSKRITVSAGSYFFWRTSTQDGIFGVPGNPLRPDEGDERYIGSQPEVQVVWRPDFHITVIAQYARFFAGPVLRASAPSDDIDFFMFRTMYAF